jgi:cytochrome c oxidase assembly protein subunit 16
MGKNPFLFFGVPFLVVIVGSSFILTSATAIRFERHDRRTRSLTQEEALNVGKNRRKVDIREEYNVS